MDSSYALERCCKKRSTPYPYTEILDMLLQVEPSGATYETVENCRESFSTRERELMPEAFEVVTSSTDDDDDNSMHSTWDLMVDIPYFTNQQN